MKLRILATTAITLTAIAVLAFAAAPSVTAQSVQPEIGQSASAIDDDVLKSFATAVVEVQRVTDTYLPMLATAQTILEQQPVDDTAYVEMKRAVENEGFTVSSFNEILALSAVSPELADRIRSHIRQPQ